MAPRLKDQREVGVALGAGRLVSGPGLAAPPGLRALNPAPPYRQAGLGPRKESGPRLLSTGAHLGFAQDLLQQSVLCPQASSRGSHSGAFFFNFKFSVRAPCGLLAPYQGLNSHPLQRKRRVLTTGLPGTSHCSRF